MLAFGERRERLARDVAVALDVSQDTIVGEAIPRSRRRASAAPTSPKTVTESACPSGLVVSML